MLDPAATSLVILGAVVVLFAWNRLPVGVVAIMAALALYLTGLLDAEAALAGFGDPIVIFIASLFVVSEGIDSTGVTAWAGQALTRRAGTGRVRLLVAVMLLCAVVTALITPNGSVAALLPMVVALAARTGRSPSQLLLPLAFAAHAGSLLALTGSPVNVIVSDAAVDAGAPAFGFAEFAIVGVPLVAGTILLAVLLGPRAALPDTGRPSAAIDLSGYAATVSGHYTLADGLYRLRLAPHSPLVGTAPDDVDLAGSPGLRLIGVQAREQPGPAGSALGPGDVLVVSGERAEVERLAATADLVVTMAPADSAELLSRDTGVVEVVVPPRSPLVGETVFPGMLRPSGLVVLAVQRLGRDRGPRPTRLAEGDALLLRGTWPAIDELVDHRDILLVNSPDLVRRQAVPMGRKAKQAIAVLGGMVVLLALGVVPPAVAGLAAAAAMVVLGVVTVPQAYQSVSWQTLVLLGGMIPLSTALADSGAADLIAGVVIDAVGAGRPYLLLVGLFLLTGVLGQVISNTATVLIVVPIALAAAADTGVDPQPVLMLVAVAGAAALLTPIATPANMMIMGPGGYHFGSYWRLGLPVMALWLLISLALIPLAWPL